VTTASFLRWPGAAEGLQPHGPGVEVPPQGQAHAEVDIEALMAEPLGFQMRMEQAAQRGPLDFDWFGWEAHFGTPPGQGNGV
jgi:hypothetical protein